MTLGTPEVGSLGSNVLPVDHYRHLMQHLICLVH
jgi:hypothetical protein